MNQGKGETSLSQIYEYLLGEVLCYLRPSLATIKYTNIFCTRNSSWEIPPDIWYLHYLWPSLATLHLWIRYIIFSQPSLANLVETSSSLKYLKMFHISISSALIFCSINLGGDLIVSNERISRGKVHFYVIFGLNGYLYLYENLLCWRMEIILYLRHKMAITIYIYTITL